MNRYLWIDIKYNPSTERIRIINEIYKKELLELNKYTQIVSTQSLAQAFEVDYREEMRTIIRELNYNHDNDISIQL